MPLGLPGALVKVRGRDRVKGRRRARARGRARARVRVRVSALLPVLGPEPRALPPEDRRSLAMEPG